MRSAHQVYGWSAPPALVLDRSDPINRGVAHRYFFNSGARVFRDIAGKNDARPPATSSIGIARGRSAFGVTTNGTYGASSRIQPDRVGRHGLDSATSPKTIVVQFRTTANVAALYCIRNTTDGTPVMDFTIGQNGVTIDNGKLMALIRGNANTGVTEVLPGVLVNDGIEHVVAWTRSSAGVNKLYLDGRRVGSSVTDTLASGLTGNVLTDATGGIQIGAEALNSAILPFAGGALSQLIVYDRELAPRELLLLKSNPYSGIYVSRRRANPSAGGGAAADLAGNATATATAAGALTTAIPVAGAAVTVATATGALSTGIALQGQIAAAAALNGDLTTVIRLNGAAIAQALAAAGITTEIRLAGAAQNTVLMQGDLQAGSGLLGNAQALAAMQGTLTTQIRLDGAAIAQALAAAGMTTEIRLAGAAQATANAAGALITGIPLVGAAQAVAVAAGSLSTAGGLAGAIASLTQAGGALSTGISLAGVVQDSVTMQGGLNATPIALEGAIASITSGDGVLSTQISMSVQALARALGTGDLIAQITFSGVALSQALAAGVLTGGSIALTVDRARRIARRARNFTIRARRGRSGLF